MTWSFSLKPVSVWKEDSAHDPEGRISSIAKSINIEVEELIFCPIVKEDEERRFVRAIVLAPNDEMSETDVKAESYRYMESPRRGNGSVRVIESMIAPVDMRINEKNVKRGSWMMTLKILDDEIWKDFERGEFIISGRSLQEI